MQGHTNAISDERSSNGRVAASAPPGPPSGAAPQLPRVVCQTKTVSHTPIHYNIPTPEPSTAPSFNGRAHQLESTYEGAVSASPCLSTPNAFPARRQGWGAPLGGGLRGGAPLPGRPPPYPTEPLAGGRRLQDRTQSAALEQDGERLPTPSNLQPPHGELLMLPMANETVDPQPVVARLIPATITFPPSQMRVRTPRCSTATESGSSNRFSRG